MTVVLQGSNRQGIDLMLFTVQTWIFPNASDAERERIMEHFDWLRVQTGNMSVNCKMETDQDGLRTRILIEASFKQVPPWKS